MLALLLMAVSGAWAQTYTVTFSGAYSGSLNKAINNVTMPYSFSAVNGQNLSPWNVIAAEVNDYLYVGVSSGGEGKVSILYDTTNTTITISGAFEGTATIHCIGLNDGEISRDVYVTCVENKVAVNSVTLSPTSATLTLGETETVTLIPTVLPDDATDKTVTWTTSNASVATVANGVVTAVAPGTATITATATNGTADTSDDKTATCEVTVSPAGYSVALKESTEDATSWQGKAGTGDYQELPLTGLEAGTAVSVKYSGTKKVKSVKAVKKAPAVTPLDNTTTAWTAGTFAVPAGGLTYSDAITVSGDVTLTLTDGETLTLNKGISLAEGATLTVEGNGTMNINGTNNSTASTVAGTGMLVLTSGTLNAKGGNGESVDMKDNYNGKSGGTAINGSVTVSGGTLKAIGGNGGDEYFTGGWENSYGGSGGTAITGSVTINSGTLTATGGKGGNLNCDDECSNLKAGNGGDAIGGSVTENGGTTTFANGSNGSASTGPECSNCNAGSGGKSHN